MSKEKASVNVNFIDKEDSEEYSCELTLKDEKVDNEENPFPGTKWYLRAFVGSDLSNVMYTNNAGSVSQFGTGTFKVNETHTISGSGSFSVRYSPSGSVSVSTVGTMYNRSGDAVSPRFTSGGSGSINISEEVFGVVKCGYTATYKKLVIGSLAEGENLITAFGTCPDGGAKFTTITVTTEESSSMSSSSQSHGSDYSYNSSDSSWSLSRNSNSSYSISTSLPDNPDDTEYNCGLTFEIFSEDNDGETTYYIGELYNARVIAESDINNILSFSTNGTLDKGSSATAAITERITFSNSKYEELSYINSGEGTAVPVGSVINSNGDTIDEVSIRVTPLSAQTPYLIYGIFDVTYEYSYDLYTFSGEEIGEALLTITADNCGGSSITTDLTVTYEESSSCCCSSSCDSSDSSEGSNKTDITIVFKDFVTGAVLPGVQVSLDGVPKGATDDSGSILLQGVNIDQAYGIKGTKSGYLNTDSDSLANDEFIIKES